MSENDFSELDRILAQREKTRKLYWASFILFWSGIAMAMSYYVVPTGTVPSPIPGIFMFGGAGLYFFVRLFIKDDLDG